MTPPDKLARLWNARLKQDGRPPRARTVQNDRAALARNDLSEAKRMRALRQRPSYLAVEAQSHDDEARLIRADDLPVPEIEMIEPASSKPSFDEMREAAKTFPPRPPRARPRKK